MDTELALKMTFMTLLSPLIIVGNILNIIVLTKMIKFSAVTRCFMINLSVADLGVGVMLALPGTVMAYMGAEAVPYQAQICVLGGMFIGICAVAMLFIMTVCIERYIAISRPITYKTRFTVKHAAIWSALNWLLVIVYVCCGLVKMYDVYHYDTDRLICTIDWKFSPIFSLIGIGGFILLPTVGVTIALIASYRAFRLSQHKLNSSKGRDERVRAQEKHLLQVFTVIIIVHYIVWTPTLIDIGYTAVMKHHPTELFAWVAAWIAFLNSFQNIVVYGVMNRTYRLTFTQIFLKPFHKLCHTTRTNYSMEHPTSKETNSTDLVPSSTS